MRLRLIGPVLIAMLLAPGAGAPAAGAATTCSLSNREQTSLGATYVTSLRVTNIGCASGKKLVKAYHACRGTPRGRCTKRVLGYSCTEKRGSSPTQITGKVTCRKSNAVVLHTYTQFV